MSDQKIHVWVSRHTKGPTPPPILQANRTENGEEFDPLPQTVADYSPQDMNLPTFLLPVQRKCSGPLNRGEGHPDYLHEWFV